jgi:hypothetical protein
MIICKHGETNPIRHNFLDSGTCGRDTFMAGRIIHKHSGFQLGCGFDSLGGFIDNILAIRKEVLNLK